MENTKTIKTPVKQHEVVLKTTISMADERALMKPFLKGVRMSMVTREGEEGEGLEAQPKLESVDPLKAIEETENILIKTMVITIDGDTENILKTVLNMDSRDGKFVIREIKKVTDALAKDFTKPESGQKENTGSGN